jgi:hypothetical protein
VAGLTPLRFGRPKIVLSWIFLVAVFWQKSLAKNPQLEWGEETAQACAKP